MMLSRPSLLLTLIAGLTAPIFADTTSEIIVRSGGYQGMGAFEGTTVRSIQGLKSFEDSKMKFTGGIMKLMGGPKDGLQIVRVDLDKIWALNPKNKTYTERAITPPPMKERPGQKPAERPSGAPSDEKPTHRIKSTAFDVKKTGTKKTINGFSTEQSVMSLKVEVEEIATKEVTTYMMENKLWLAPMTGVLKKHLEEEKRFVQAYMKKLGFGFAAGDPRVMSVGALKMLLGVGGPEMEKLLDQVQTKAGALNGYPIVTDSTWTMQEDPKAVARREAAMDDAAMNEEETPDLTGGAKGIAGGLISGFAKKKVKQHQAKKAEERAGKPAYASYTEVVRISDAAIPDATFEVPAGYKLKK